jgi:predicted Zn-dependent peptidase
MTHGFLRSRSNRWPRRALALAPALLTVVLGVAAADAAQAKGKGTPAAPPAGPNVPVEEHVLGNGMKLLLIPQHVAPIVAGAWVAHVGSANERPGITGISHLFEHMMFKGSHVIGTRDYEKDVRLIDEQERVQDEMRAEMSKMREARRRGEIDDITKPEARTPRYVQLEARFDSLVAAQRENMVKNEFDLTLQKNGGTFVNAFTTEDMTVYFETLPANKLELWFWMESDRIKNRVFREFYSERDVVYEERRRSVESTATGQYELAFEAMFWEASPYGWPVLGWPSDIRNVSKAQADEYYSLYYAPQNLTAILVGDFDPKQALAMAEKYLGAIPAGPRPAPEMITNETASVAEKRMIAEAETNPGIDARWHTVAYVHSDVPALDVLEGILNGPTGRLQKDLVLGAGIANSASASSDNRKYEGSFAMSAECKEGHAPEEVERALYAEIEKLQKEPVSNEELQKVRNRYLASSYRMLGTYQALLFRYVTAEGMGTWRDADRIDKAVQTVTAADVQRVAQKYFTKENRAVVVWTRKAGTAAEDPAIANLPDQAKGMVKGMLARINGATDAAQVQQMIERMDQMGGQAPPEFKPALDYLRAKAQEKISQLQAGK